MQLDKLNMALMTMFLGPEFDLSHEIQIMARLRQRPNHEQAEELQRYGMTVADDILARGSASWQDIDALAELGYVHGLEDAPPHPGIMDNSFFHTLVTTTKRP